jgi:hypothetical protein
MTWRIQWQSDGKAEAHHAPTGAIFRVSQDGWMGVKEAPGLCEEIVSGLLIELRQELERPSTEPPAASKGVGSPVLAPLWAKESSDT